MSIKKIDKKILKYLRFVKEKVLELTAIETTIDDDIKLTIILNSLFKKYCYFIVTFKQQIKIDFDKLFAKLIEK